MTKANERRFRKAVSEMSAENLVAAVIDESDSVTRLDVAEWFMWGAVEKKIELEKRAARGRFEILRAELLRRLGGAQ